MKFFLKLSVVAVALIFASCSDDDDDKDSLIGKWNVVSVSDESLSEWDKKSYFTFREDELTVVNYELDNDICY